MTGDDRRYGKTPGVLLWALIGLGAVRAIYLNGQESQLSDKQALTIIEEKCLQCHGDAMQMSGLDLRTRESALKGGAKGPVIVPGDVQASRLYRRAAGLEQPAMPMAPSPRLTPDDVAVLKSWIERGATWVTTAAKTANDKLPSPGGYSYQERPITEANRNWWAFRKPVHHSIPDVADERWKRNPIDAFVKKSLDEKGLTPAPQADRNTLVRRAYLDLTGLLPSPQEVDAFVNDSSPLAWENLIDRLLESSHYGERWGRFWLDVTRYADSSGYEQDYDIPNAWRYRDYVIKSFNRDTPYNRFIVEQLAGDEIEDRDPDSLIATGFYRIGPRVRFREKDNPYYRYEYLDDIIRTTFQGFMGLSVNCARCHDHKFDPISRMDYYRSMAIFSGYVNYDYPLAPPDKVAEHDKAKKEVEDQIRPLMRQIAQIEAPYKKAAYEARLAKFPEEIQRAVKTPEEKRTPGQKLLAAQIASLDVDPDNVNVNVTANFKPTVKVNDADNEARQKLVSQIEELQKKLPGPLPLAEGIRDGDYRLTPDGPGDEPLPGKGERFDYHLDCCFLPQPGRHYQPPPVYFGANGLDVAEDQKSFIVEPGYLRVLAADTALAAHAPTNGNISSGRRRALAEWIASPENPLTARVMANRVWHWHFGHGIVSTPGNFGKMGSLPSHPELLDWLATEFIRQNWSIKQLHRLIMNSETYKMASSYSTAQNKEKDPEDVYLWRFPLRRLEAEAIRDAILCASGQINLTAGGPAFFPSIPKSVRESYRQGIWTLTKEEPATWRRSVYSYWKRGLKYPMFDVHDQPDQNVTAEKRNVTTVPTQALTLLNNEFVLIQARLFAERVMNEAGDDAAKQIRVAYRIALGREPTQKEQEKFQEFMMKQRKYHEARMPADQVRLAALTDLAHVILNANEFVYMN